MMEPTGENQPKSFKDKIASIFRREKSPQELLGQQVLKEAELIAGKKLSKDMYWEQLTPDQRARLEERRRTAESNLGMQTDSYPVPSDKEDQVVEDKPEDGTNKPAPDLLRTYGNNTSVDASGGAMTSQEKMDAMMRQKYNPDDLEGLNKSLDKLMNQMWSDPNEELQKEIRYVKALIKNQIPTVVDEPDFLNRLPDLDSEEKLQPLANIEELNNLLGGAPESLAANLVGMDSLGYFGASQFGSDELLDRINLQQLDTDIMIADFVSKRIIEGGIDSFVGRDMLSYYYEYATRLKELIGLARELKKSREGGLSGRKEDYRKDLEKAATAFEAVSSVVFPAQSEPAA